MKKFNNLGGKLFCSLNALNVSIHVFIIGMVEYSRVAGSSLTGGTVLCPFAKTVILCL